MQTLELLGDTKARILSQLVKNPTNAIQLAKILRIQASAVRKHLDQMEELGIIKGSFQRSSVGRPKKVYQATPQGKELFPRKYDVVLEATLAQLTRSRNEKFAESVLASVADDLASSSFGEAMGRAGFQATVEDKGDSYLVTSRNCPLLRTAEEHREVICRGLHENFLKRGLDGSEVAREKWIVSGDQCCTHIVRKQRVA